MTVISPYKMDPAQSVQLPRNEWAERGRSDANLPSIDEAPFSFVREKNGGWGGRGRVRVQRSALSALAAGERLRDRGAGIGRKKEQESSLAPHMKSLTILVSALLPSVATSATSAATSPRRARGLPAHAGLRTYRILLS